MAKKKNKQGTLKSKGTATISSTFKGTTVLPATTVKAAGTNTESTAATTPNTTTNKITYGSSWNSPNLTKVDPYTESEAVTQAKSLYDKYVNGEGRPAYTSKYADTISALADKIANREAFNYNFNEDPLYQNYRDQYQRQATLGQQGAMANAAALTGGYGSSYAQTAGNLAYQENMANLNNVIPQLYEMAYNKYNTDLDNQRADLSMYQGLEDSDYGRYRDSVSDWNGDRDFYTNNYNNERNFDYTRHQDNVNNIHWTDEMKQNDYQAGKNYTSSEHWNKKNFNYQKEQDKIARKQWEKEFNLAKKAKTSGGSGGGGYRRYGSGSGSSSSRLSQEAYRAYQKELQKFKNGNAPQKEIAANVLNRLAAKYNLNEAQQNRVWSQLLGFKDTPSVKTNGRHDNSKNIKYQTYLDIPKKIRDKVEKGKLNIMTDSEFTSYVAQNKGKSKYKNYEAYLKAIAKKYGF